MKKVDCPAVRISPREAQQYHYFFGYYDKNPWDVAGHRILAHRVPFIDRFPEPEDRAEVGYLSTDGRSEFTRLGESSAWNWQQGAQLQWSGRTDNGRQKILFNDRRNNRLVTVILDPDSGNQTLIDYPIYTVSPSGQIALSVNYARLFDMRQDYGIAGLVDPYKEVLRPEQDGVSSVDLYTGECKLIVSIAQVADVSPTPLGENAKHWVNHMMFNPSGTRFCFLHLFWRQDRILYSRLLTSDVQGRDVRLLFEGFISHYCWKDETTILAWASRRRLLGSSKARAGRLKIWLRRSLKPMYYAMGKPRILMRRVMGDSLYFIQDRADGGAERFAHGELTSDGHCTFSPDHRWVLTDGYTDSRNRLPLFLYDTHNAEVVEIGRFPTPTTLDGPLRVDLHPRFNRDGTQVCIDSAMDGTRQMYVIDIADLVKA